MSKHLAIVAIFAALVTPLMVAAQTTGAAQQPQTEAKAKKPGRGGIGGTPGKADGKVTAVTDTSITVKSKTGESTFAVDKDTRITATGSSHKTAAGRKSKPPVFSDTVKTGDTVSVRFLDNGTTKRAESVTVRPKSERQ